MAQTPRSHPKSQSQLLGFKPEKNERHGRSKQFVLDCTNPILSHMPQYQPDHDQYNTSYISLVFSSIAHEKQNQGSQSPQFKITKMKSPKTISHQSFRDFLQKKMKSLTQLIQYPGTNPQPHFEVDKGDGLARGERLRGGGRQQCFKRKAKGVMRGTR